MGTEINELLKHWSDKKVELSQTFKVLFGNFTVAKKACSAAEDACNQPACKKGRGKKAKALAQALAKALAQANEELQIHSDSLRTYAAELLVDQYLKVSMLV